MVTSMSTLTYTRRIHPAWWVFIVTFLTLVAAAGFRSSTSVLILPLENAFGWSRSTISFALGVNVLLYGFISPFAAALMERFGMRRVVMTALTIVGTGTLLSLWMTQPWELVLLWGVVVGLGTGSMALVFAASVANRWFIKRKGLVVGILTAGSATGQLIFLPLLSSLALHHGWKMVSTTTALCALGVVPLIFLFLREKPSVIGAKPYGAPDDYVETFIPKRNAAQEALSALREGSKHRDFWYLVGSFFVCGLSTSGLVGTHFIPAAHDHGLPQVTAASLLALIGVFDIIGTIASGWLTDRIDPRKLLFFYYLTRGLSLFLLPSILYSTLKAQTLVFIIFYGLDWVATVPPTLLLCRNVLGPARGTVIYGWTFAAHSIGGAIAVYGAALLRVQFGNYASAFYISGAMCVVASYAVLQISSPKKNERVVAVSY